MEDTTLRMVYIFTDIIVPMLVGYTAKCRRWLTPAQTNWLIRFNIIVVVTVLTLLSFWVLPLRTDLLSLPFFAFFNGLLPLFVVLLLGRQRKFTDFVDRGSYLIAAIPANTGMLGGLCCYILYGEMAYAYVQIIGVFQNLLMFFVLFPMGYYYQHGGREHNFFVFFRNNWQAIFINWNQLSVVAIFIGIGLHAAGVPRPAVFTPVFQALVHVSAWVALIPVGYLIDFSHFKAYAAKTLDLIPIKMILTPLVSYFVALLFTSDPVLLGTIIIVMATPCAINALITERLYDLNVNLAMAPFITTQLLYILILYPAFYLLVSFGILPFK
ncbi:MAG: AEC family transporter [Megasphaera sp.]|uniref:AEC family transporter n=1 Tax=Megasphaera sp. TaxID=2023260 RepID=UPI003F0DF742